MRQGKRIAIGFALIAILLATMLAPVWAQTPITRLGTVIIKTLTVQQDTTVGDDLTVTDDATVGSTLNLTPATGIVVTMNATITPLGSYQPISSAGTVNTSSITVGSAGDELTLVNTSNTSIVFTDTGTLKLSGNITLGQFDSLRLISDGTNWVQLGTANN